MIGVCLVAFAACSDPAPPIRVSSSNVAANRTAPVDEHFSDAPRISLADAKKDFDNGTALFIDTHAKAQYDSQHIKGSINVPANDVGNKLDAIPKDKKIIAYCS